MNEEIKNRLLNDAQWLKFIDSNGGLNMLRIPYEGIDFILFKTDSNSIITCIMNGSISNAANKLDLTISFEETALQVFQNAIGI